MKELILKALRSIVQGCSTKNPNARFVYLNIIKEVNSTVQPLGVLDDLKKLKYVKEKTYQKIYEAILKICSSEEIASFSNENYIEKGYIENNYIENNYIEKGIEKGYIENNYMEKGIEKGYIEEDMNIENDNDSSLIILKTNFSDNLDDFLNTKPLHLNKSTNSENSSIKRIKLDSQSSPIIVTENINNGKQCISNTVNIVNTDNIVNEINKVNTFNKVNTVNTVNNANTVNTIVNKRNEVNKANTINTINADIKVNTNKKYIPGYRTAAYAILRVLFNLNGAHKYLIALKASPFTDAEFDKTLKFSAFSAFKILEKKNLIYCEESKYYITESGQNLCKSLFNMSSEETRDSTIKLIIDSREKRSNRDRTFFQSFFNARNILNDTRFLGVGDFLWVRGENIVNCIIERKQGGDFMSSIADGRYREQKERLKLFGFRVFYIIEGLRGQNGAYSLMETKMDAFVVVETDDANESGEFILKIDAAVKMDTNTIMDKKIFNFSERMSYGTFLEDGGKNRDLNCYKMLLVALLSVKGLGKKRAVALAGMHGSFNEFLIACENPNFADVLAKVMLCGSVIGRKLAFKIVNLIL